MSVWLNIVEPYKSPENFGLTPLSPRICLDVEAMVISYVYAFVNWKQRTKLQPKPIRNVCSSFWGAFICKKNTKFLKPGHFLLTALYNTLCRDLGCAPSLLRHICLLQRHSLYVSCWIHIVEIKSWVFDLMYELHYSQLCRLAPVSSLPGKCHQDSSKQTKLS